MPPHHIYGREEQQRTILPYLDRAIKHHFDPGLNPITMVMTAAGCSNTYFDTIKVDTFLTMHLPKDFPTCIGTKVSLTAVTQYSKGKLTFKWGSGKTVFPEKIATKVLIITRGHVYILYSQRYIRMCSNRYSKHKKA